MRMKKISIFFLLSIGLGQFLSAQNEKAENIKTKYNQSLQRVFQIQEQVQDIHPLLERVFPIAILEDNHFYLFDVDPSERKYVFIKDAPAKIEFPSGIRASFPLDFYGNRIACVTSGDAFESVDGPIMVFHEFIHCSQWESCELKIKQNLGIAQKAMAEKNYMWELNHPFPFDNQKFRDVYSSLLLAWEANNAAEFFKLRRELKRILSQDDFEYMVWQEWKEGFACFIENKIRNRLEVEENHFGRSEPSSRMAFYEGGAAFIEFLTSRQPSLLEDIESLFYRMMNQS
jgi:hypothetical protein